MGGLIDGGPVVPKKFFLAFLLLAQSPKGQDRLASPDMKRDPGVTVLTLDALKENAKQPLALLMEPARPAGMKSTPMRLCLVTEPDRTSSPP